MKRVKILNNQTLLDVAVMHYGTAEAISEILFNNPGIKNDIKTIIDSGRNISEFYPDLKLEVGAMLFIDENSLINRKTIIKKINRSINTYTTEQWQDQLSKYKQQ